MATFKQGFKSQKRPPTAGTLVHLDYLANLEIPSPREDANLAEYMARTQAARSLAIHIKRHRIFRPVRSAYIELDSNLMQVEPDSVWKPLFKGSLYRDPLHPKRSQMTVGGQPEWADYSYNLRVPIDYNLNYDPSRHSDAVFYDSKQRPTDVYNQSAFDEYHEDDPRVLMRALQEGAADLATLLRSAYGLEDAPIAAPAHRFKAVDFVLSKTA